MATRTEMRIEELKTELRAAEAALATAKTLDSGFNETRNDVNRAQQLLNLADQRLREAVSGAESLALEAAAIPYVFPEKRNEKDNDVRKQRAAVHDLEVKRNAAELDLRSTRAAHEMIKSKIADHPQYASVRKKQGELVAQATKLARSLFSVPLDELGAVLNKLSLVADAERDLIESTRVALRECGLPEIRMLLGAFVAMVTPQFADQIPVARTYAYERVKQVEEFASRTVLA